jgi:hypothetical protein
MSFVFYPNRKSSYYVLTGSSLTRIVHLDMLKDFSYGFWRKGGPNDMLLEQDGASHYLHAAVRTVLPGSNDLTEMDWKSRLASTSWPPPSTDTTPV